MPRRPRDRADLTSASPPTSGRFADALRAKGHTPETPANAGPRPWLGIHFACCNVYARVYRSRTAPRYEGHCPSCQAKISVPIGKGGTNQRFFEAI